MLSFATEFPVADDLTSCNFLQVVRGWLAGSPHTRLSPADIASLDSEGQHTVRLGDESLVSLRWVAGTHDACSIRYVKSQDGIEWTTTVTFSRAEHDALVAVRVFCESMHPATRMPLAKKPLIVRKLLQVLGGGNDGELRVGATPHVLTGMQVDSAARIIRGDACCRLPVVYVSADFRGRHVLDTSRLAIHVAGMAHVVVEPDRPFSVRLMLETGAANVYGGTVGIYWPNGGGKKSFFIGGEFQTGSELAKAVYEELRTALTNRRPLERCTWASVQELVSRKAIEELKASGSHHVDAYIESFDKELSAKAEQLDDAEREIRRLNAELRIYAARTSAGLGIVLKSGNVEALYAHEVSDILIDSLASYSGKVPNDSRRSHVVAALLAANPSAGEAAALRDRLKEILRGFSGLDQGSRRALEDLGFVISEDGKHTKIVFQGDDRYTFTLPKTGSDYRGGLNAASDIGRLLF